MATQLRLSVDRKETDFVLDGADGPVALGGGGRLVALGRPGQVVLDVALAYVREDDGFLFGRRFLKKRHRNMNI